MKTNKELDERLRAFIQAPDNFLASVGLVTALHQEKIIASSKPYALEIEGRRVVPVFSDANDLENLKADQASAAQQNWTLRSTFQVLQEAIQADLDGLVFNLKDSGDFANSTILESAELLQFLNHYTNLLNDVMGDANLAADTLEKNYLVPAFIHGREDGGYDRLFPTMSTPEGKSYVPVFSDLVSFAKWYNHKDFGAPFRKAQGVILTWTLEELYQPTNGDNDIDDTVGVVVNAFDQQQILVEWSEIDVED